MQTSDRSNTTSQHVRPSGPQSPLYWCDWSFAFPRDAIADAPEASLEQHDHNHTTAASVTSPTSPVQLASESWGFYSSAKGEALSDVDATTSPDASNAWTPSQLLAVRSLRAKYSTELLMSLQMMPNLTSLCLRGLETWTDIAFLRHVPSSVKELRIEGCPWLTDVSPMASLTSLEVLHLDWCLLLADVTPLAALTSLKTLSLSWCFVLTDISPLASLTSLRTLSLTSCPWLTDVSPLASLKCLETLSLDWCGRLLDLQPLASLTSLETLALTGCSGLTDVTPIASLTGLRKLRLDGCDGISDYSPLASLKMLKSSWCTPAGALDQVHTFVRSLMFKFTNPLHTLPFLFFCFTHFLLLCSHTR